ncbi:hypothetical protein ACERK3_19450 [Phycisphaerales bacterium AB-hyl4]|uniref:Uncharacterized protein n=1 Tax=Natronomicrosphaera hydrolytica TaxID=3242702 RepID=A0ABV4UBS2_9BACT
MMHWLDALIIVIYLSAVVGVGILARGRQQNADDYFTGSGGFSGPIGSIFVGLSIAATLFSGISFLAYPSVFYDGGTELLAVLIVFPLALAVLALYFLPRYLSGRSQSPYAIIERRFGLSTRTVAASMFILLRIGWMAALIYAPTIAIMAAADLGPPWFWPLVLTIGLSSTIYTTLGGIRGVIVTDAIQFLVIAGGIALTIGYVVLYLPASWSAAAASLADSGHLHRPNMSLDLTTQLTIWSVVIGGTVANFGSYMGDQMSLQRYLVLGSTKAAARSFAINVVGVVVVLVMLAGVGLALASWYQHVPDANLPADADKVFPHFVSTQLPIGLAGLLLAAILAATMSSMTSGINALASTLTMDFRLRFGRQLSPQKQLRFARVTSLTIGVLSTVIAGFVGALGSIFDIAQTLLGVFLGPLLACMLLAVSRWPVAGRAVIAGLITGGIVGGAVALSPIASLWVAPFAFGSTLLVVVAVRSLVNDTREPEVLGAEES